VSAHARNSHQLAPVRSDTLVCHDMADALWYKRRDPETTVLYRVVQQNLETFLATAREQGRVVPRFVEREFRPISPAESSPTASCACTATTAVTIASSLHCGAVTSARP
jgi:hypothetical protein